ncbi:hypothetical protein GCM10009841_31100 [Microlunatus panaciterrae]|uniref:Uncharacterized protein n=1 Tax=Microlunatus panaciterrae TaxID=400768 RepID=A0ABS2RFJ3_9ACTN|nr:DUF6703 family protein [Microlunatus panaciterrae]MBM7797770.1 hypothetical protein [Microlunatus panaciterrae]
MSSQQVTFRQQVETRSRPALARLHEQPRLLIPLATLVLIALGAFAPMPYALAAFALVFAFIAWIAYLSWPVVPLSGRLMRLAMLALICVLAATRF